jgi:acetyl esterase/lipase
MRIVFALPGMESVKVHRDLVYKNADGIALQMDVYAPPDGTPRRPAVILVHGGPIPQIGAKNAAVFVSYGELLAASGFVAIAFDHRFLAPNRISDAAQDVADAVAFVRNNGESLGVDPGRMAIWAFSGGGLFLSAFLRQRSDWLRALVAYYALMELQQLPAELDAGSTDEMRETFSAASSLGNDARTAPPLLIARAGQDWPWLNEGIDRFVQKALLAGATLDLLNHPDGRHGFDILDDDARSRQIISHTLAYLKNHIAPH